MSFTGIYQLEYQENFEPFMRATGLPDEHIQTGKDIKSISETVDSGDNFKGTRGSKVLASTFSTGNEAAHEAVTGEKIKVVVHCEGNKLKVSLRGSEPVTEPVDGNMIISSLL